MHHGRRGSSDSHKNPQLTRTKHPVSMTPQIILSTLTVLSGGLAGAIAANSFTIWRDRRGRKHAFRGYVRSVLAEFQAIDLKSLQQGQLVQRHRATVPGVRAECARVYDDIRAGRQSKFEVVWVAYCGLKQQDVEPYDHFDPVTSPTAISFPNYERGSQKIASLLTEMLKHAK